MKINGKNEKGVLVYVHNTTHSSLYIQYNAYKFFWINKIVYNVKHPPAYTYYICISLVVGLVHRKRNIL